MKKLTHHNHDTLEAKALKMVEGFRGLPANTPQLVFRNETMVPAQVVARFQAALNGFQGIRDAEDAHQEAIDSVEKEMRQFQAFHDEAVTVVKSHFGSDTKKLAAFGLAPAKQSRRGRGRGRPSQEVIRTTVVEEVFDGREPVIEVIETEAMVETSAPLRRERREERASTPASTPVLGMVATLPGSTVKPSGKRSKSKQGSRRRARAHAGLRTAISNRRLAMKQDRALYEDLVLFLKHHLGRSNPMLTTYGVRLPKTRTPLTVEASAIARAKAAATRRARGRAGGAEDAQLAGLSAAHDGHVGPLEERAVACTIELGLRPRDAASRRGRRNRHA